MEKEYIYGSLEYCYGEIPIIRGFCSYKTIIKHSKAHPAYQRTIEDKHVCEIESFLLSNSYKYYVVLAFPTGM